MCQPTIDIKFCTCLVGGNINTVIHNKRSRRRKNETQNNYRWTLYRYVGVYDSGMDGMLVMPGDKLGQKLIAMEILGELNHKNCFDFNYSPNEGDNLEIFEEGQRQMRFLSFIFKAGFWKIDSYNGFYEQTEKINYGSIKLE